MKLRTFSYFLKEAFVSMRRNGLMTLASISTVALSLFMLGVFLCGVVNLNNMAANLETQVQISVYLRDDLNTNQIMEVGKQVKA
ncbi:MAG: ABC transporter permease, partial [Veillonella sp.]|nr:ABC transporter permease [Veillonella sp.]